MEETTIKNENKRGKNMEFLKTILGDELYNQFAEKLNAYNGNEENKDYTFKSNFRFERVKRRWNICDIYSAVDACKSNPKHHKRNMHNYL